MVVKKTFEDKSNGYDYARHKAFSKIAIIVDCQNCHNFGVSQKFCQLQILAILAIMAIVAILFLCLK
jgi:hypothetical protein